MNREVFEKWVTRDFILRAYGASRDYTYIARSEDGRVYKIGLSRNPKKREGKFSGGYKRFHFKILYFFPGHICCELLRGLHFAGAKQALPQGVYKKRREAYFLSREDIDYLAQTCLFRPIEELTI